MEAINPQENQNIFDIALQEYGSIETVFDILHDNDMYNVTDEISVYEELKVGREAFRQDIVSYYDTNNVNPATNASEEEEKLLAEFEGVDYMTVGNNFIVR